MTKAALSLNELSELWTADLDKIDLVEQDQRVILQAKAEVERSADGMITRGMEAQNQNQVCIVTYDSNSTLKSNYFLIAKGGSGRASVPKFGRPGAEAGKAAYERWKFGKAGVGYRARH